MLSLDRLLQTPVHLQDIMWTLKNPLNNPKHHLLILCPFKVSDCGSDVGSDVWDRAAANPIPQLEAPCGHQVWYCIHPRSCSNSKQNKSITREEQILNKIKHHTYYQQSHLDTAALRTLSGTKKLYIKNLNPPTIPAVATVDEERGEETEEKPKATKRKPTKRKASRSLGKRKEQRLFPRKTRVIRLIRIRSLMGQVVRVMMPFWHRLLKGIAPSSVLCHAACGPLLPAMENILHCVPRLRT